MNHVADSDSDQELDWLAEEFNFIYEKCSNIQFGQKALMENIEEQNKYLEYDNEDPDDKFYLFGEDEDAFC